MVGGLSDQNKIALLYISKNSQMLVEEDLFDTLITLCKEILNVITQPPELLGWGTFSSNQVYIETIPPRQFITLRRLFLDRHFRPEILIIPDLRQAPQFLDDQETTKCVIQYQLLIRMTS